LTLPRISMSYKCMRGGGLEKRSYTV